MKRKFAIIFLAIIMTLCTAVGCSNGGKANVDGMVKVVYHLEGGVYRNCTAPIVLYYGFKEGAENKLKDPAAADKKDRPKSDDDKAQVTRNEYEIDGWYRVKNGEGDEAVYADRWNFATDKVNAEGVELYAKWVPVIRFTYNVCYIDEDGNKQVLGSYNVNAGDTFSDKFNYRNNRSGYTALAGYYDENDNPWDESFTHPGGEVNTAIDVFVKYEKGEFVQVYTASDLIASRNKDIMLMADIDFEGKSFSFGDYKKIFRGNGHTISNFNLSYDPSRGALIDDEDLGDEGGILAISLFGCMNGATVQDVTFENFTINVETTLRQTKKIIVAPLCVKAEKSTVSNVTVKPVYTVTQLPATIKNDPESLVFVTDKAYYFERESTFENVTVTVDDKTNEN